MSGSFSSCLDPRISKNPGQKHDPGQYPIKMLDYFMVNVSQIVAPKVFLHENAKRGPFLNPLGSYESPGLMAGAFGVA